VAVVVDVRLAQVLVLRVLVRQMGVGNGAVVVLVLMQRREVLPFTHHFVRSLASIVGHVGVLVRVDDGFVTVLHIISHMRTLADLVQHSPRW
jgi:hypothetical protein